MRAARPAAAATSNQELCVLIRCHDLLLAIATRWVERLVPLAELPLIPGSAPVAADAQSSGRIGLIEVNGARVTAWDLAAMVGLTAAPEAWVILRGVTSSGDPAPVPLALRAGRCVKVAPLPRSTPLPGGLFRTRATAWSGVARGADLSAPSTDAIGLILDPSRLWTAAELTLSRRLAKEAGRGRS